MARPRGTFGPVARALLDAAAKEPGTVRELAARAQVGYAAANWTTSRLVAAGVLVNTSDRRPAVLRKAEAREPAAVSVQAVLSSWARA